MGNCKVSPGALVSFGTVIANDTTVQGTGRITRFKRKRGYEHDELVKGAADPKVVGKGGEGFKTLIPQLKLRDDDDDAASISTLNSEDEDDSDFETDSQPRSHRTESFGSINSEESA